MAVVGEAACGCVAIAVASLYFYYEDRGEFEEVKRKMHKRKKPNKGK